MDEAGGELQEEQIFGCDLVFGKLNKYNDWDAHLMRAIAEAESGCREDAIGDGHLTYYQNGRQYGYSVGSLQVRILPGRESCELDTTSDSYYECAHNIWLSQGYAAWSVWLNGRYLSYL